LNLGDLGRCKPILAFLSEWTDTHGITMQSMISWGVGSATEILTLNLVWQMPYHKMNSCCLFFAQR
jgi:hypothetical protein